MEGRRVCALAGRRVDAADAAPRFALDQVEVVRGRLRQVLTDRAVRTLVASAACGTDLIALDVARELGIRRRVILPFDADEFRRTSVVDRPGDWGSIYDRLVEEIRRSNDLVVLKPAADRDRSYLLANEAILDHALALAVSPSQALAIIAWEGQPRGSDDATHQFAESARRRGLEVVTVSTG